MPFSALKNKKDYINFYRIFNLDPELLIKNDVDKMQMSLWKEADSFGWKGDTFLIKSKNPF